MPIAYIGLSLYAEAVAPSSATQESWICGFVLFMAFAVFLRWGLARRLRLNKRDWETKWSQVVPPGLITDLFKRYHDID